MRPEPSCKLDPKVKSVWRTAAAIVWSLIWVICLLCVLIPALVTGEPVLYGFSIAFVVLWIICLVVFVGILPALRYMRFRYEVCDNEVDLMHGIFWRTRTLVPYIRVQNTDTSQGPLLRRAGLAKVTVATAAGEHAIPGLLMDEADALRDSIAEQVRLAREDM